MVDDFWGGGLADLHFLGFIQEAYLDANLAAVRIRVVRLRPAILAESSKRKPISKMVRNTNASSCLAERV